MYLKLSLWEVQLLVLATSVVFNSEPQFTDSISMSFELFPGILNVLNIIEKIEVMYTR